MLMEILMLITFGEERDEGGFWRDLEDELAGDIEVGSKLYINLFQMTLPKKKKLFQMGPTMEMHLPQDNLISIIKKKKG